MNIREELGVMHDKLTHYGQFVWMNIVLESWQQAYKGAYESVVGTWGQRKTESALSLTSLAVLVGTRHWAVQLAMGPLLYGLGKVLDKPKSLPTSVATAPDKLIGDYKLYFGKLLAVCSQSIIELYDKQIPEDEFLAFRSRALLSPIWFPPKQPDVGELQKKIERRLWAKLLLELKSGTVGADIRKYVDVKLPSDDPTEVDLIKYHKLMNELIVYPYRGSNNDSTKETWKPVFYELSRPDPLYFPLPKRVQDIVDRVGSLVNQMTAFGYIEASQAHVSSATEMAMAEVPKTLRLDWSFVPAR
jgi:hypothetical protein